MAMPRMTLGTPNVWPTGNVDGDLETLTMVSLGKLASALGERATYITNNVG
jgi:hypothetical protein